MSIPRGNKANNGILSSNKSPRKEYDRRHGAQRYCVLFKKEGIPERKFASHSSDDCTGVRTKRSIKDGMVGPIGGRTHAVQYHNKSENKWKKELKALKNQNNMLYIIAEKSSSRRDIKKIKNIKSEASKKTRVSSNEDWY